MQSVSSTLFNRLLNIFDPLDPDPVRKPAEFAEFYSYDYIPPEEGFDPADAVQKFAFIEYTWNGRAYRRNILTRGDIQKQIGQQTNSVSLSFSNIDRYMATWAQTTQIEGMWCVIRYVERDIEDDSLVLFVGRASKPSTINNKSFSLSVSSEIGNINQEIPPRTFTADDPEGRDPSDPLFEGFRFVAQSGTLVYPVVVPAHHGIARLFGQRDTDYIAKQFSSVDGTPYGSVLPEVLGRAQMKLIPFIWMDHGAHIGYNMAACAGPIQDIPLDTLRTITQGFSNPVNSVSVPPAPAEIHLGDLGGTGTNAAGWIQFPTAGLFSHTAGISAASTGSALDVTDGPPEVVGLIIGRIMPLPNSSGVYDQTGWTDNPVHHARWVFTYLLGVNAAFMEDAVNYRTSLKCDTFLLDESNSERVLISGTDMPQTGSTVRRFRSTGVISSRLIRRLWFDEDYSPWLDGPENDYETLDFENLPSVYTVRRFYRKRYTFNAPITERVKAVDFLYKMLYPVARLYHRFNGKGRLEILTEEAEDNCYLRSSTLVGATSIPVDDVTPWKDSLQGKLLIGATEDLLTSENRRITSASYSADGNSITLSASASGVSATASGATLSGGSTSVQASGTVTLSGTAGAGASVTVTINGIVTSYILDGDDSLASATAILAQYLNADTRLNRYIVASYIGLVITIRAKLGTLNFTPALAFAHTGPRANPTTAPTLGQSAGTMAAGVYLLAYAYNTVLGKTLISPTASIALTADKRVDVSAITLPAGVTSVDWFMSDAPDSDKLLFFYNNDGTGFSVDGLPSKDNEGVPPFNSTGEECIRVAMSFSSNSQGATILAQSGLTRANIKTDSYNFPLGSEQSSVNQIKGKFTDAKNDFALTPFEVNDRDHQLTLNGKKNPLEVDLSGVDNWHQAFRLANGLLSKYRDGDWFNSLGTGTGEALLLEEGDVISSSDDSGGHVNVTTRIESLSISSKWEVTIRKARKYSSLMYSDDVRQHSIPIPSTLRFVQTVNTYADYLDLPIWRDEDADKGPGFYFAASRDLSVLGDWRGWGLYADYDGKYKKIADGDIAAIVGNALGSALASGTTLGFDRVNTVTVNLINGELSSATEEEVLQGANKIKIGAEILHYVTATEITTVAGYQHTYVLSTLLRGRHGTEWATTSHTAFDTFVLLDSRIQYVPIDLSRLNRAFNYRAVTTNQDVADASITSFTWNGASLRPLAPVDLRGSRDTRGNLLIEFEPRSRIGGGVRSYNFGAVGEEREEYRVEILSSDGLTIKRTIPVVSGTALPAIIQSVSEPSDAGGTIDGHSVDAALGYSVYAGAYQLLSESGAFVEATLESTGGSARIRLMPNSVEWRSVNPNGVFYEVQLTGTGTLFGSVRYPDATIPPVPNWESPVDEDPTGGVLYRARVRIMLSGTEIRFYKDYLNSGTPPEFVSSLTPQLPLRVWMLASGGQAIRDVIIATPKHPKTVYSAAQQSEPTDFGSTQASVRVRVYQLSPFVGPGQSVEGEI